MSDFFPRVWALDIEPGPKFTLMAIARFSILKGACWASVATIGKATGFTARTTRSHLQVLEDAGLIEKRERRRANGSQSTNVIWLKLPELTLPPVTPPVRTDRDIDAQMMHDLNSQGAEEFSEDDETGRKETHLQSETISPTPRKQTAPPERLGTSGKKKDSLSDSDESDPDDSKRSDSKTEREELNRLMESVWEAASVYGRKRATREKVADAIAKALKPGKITGEELVAAWRAYAASPEASKQDGLYQKAPDRWIRNGLYETWVEELRAARSPRPEGEAVGSRDLGSYDEPTPFGQEVWMIGYVKRSSWSERYGPEPGDEGCRVSAEIQRKFGVIPFEDRQQ